MGAYSEQAGFQKQLKQALPLAHRTSKAAKQFDVRVFLKFIEHKRIFGESFKEQIEDLYDLMHKTMEYVDKLHNESNPKKRENILDMIAKATLASEKKKNEILDSLDEGKRDLSEASSRLAYFWNNYKIMTMFLAKLRTKLPDVPSVTDMQTIIQHQITLFSAINEAYKHDSIEIETLLDNEFRKIDEQVKKNNNEPINFKPILAHIKYVEGKLDEIITKAEEEDKLSKLARKRMSAAEQALVTMLKKDVDDWKEAFKTAK